MQQQRQKTSLLFLLHFLLAQRSFSLCNLLRHLNSMLTLLKAEDIVNIGLTCTQVFYLVGKQATKGLCRFVKTDTIKTAIATLLAIKGDRTNVEDIRLIDFGGLKIWTDQGIQHLPRAEVRAFLTRYNQLATDGCATECKCAEDSENLWKQFCVHRIAEHLAGVKEKVTAVVEAAKTLVALTSVPVQRLLNEVMYHIGKENLVAFPSEEDGDFFVKVCQYDKTILGHVIIAADGTLSILSAVPGSREIGVKAVLTAIARLKAAIFPPIPPGTPSGFREYRDRR